MQSPEDVHIQRAIYIILDNLGFEGVTMGAQQELVASYKAYLAFLATGISSLARHNNRSSPSLLDADILLQKLKIRPADLLSFSKLSPPSNAAKAECRKEILASDIQRIVSDGLPAFPTPHSYLNTRVCDE